jgi:hypothetical protein
VCDGGDERERGASGGASERHAVLECGESREVYRALARPIRVQP